MESVVKAVRWATAILCFFILQSSIPEGAGENSPESFMLGVKIYDYAGRFPDLFEEWRSLGINTAFVSTPLASNPEFRDLARKNRVAIFIILPIFFNAEELEKRPDLYAITNRGEKAVDNWVKFVCPAREDYRREKIDEVKKKEAYLTEILSVSEFKEAFAESLKPPSRGVIFWNWDTLSQSPEKKEVVKAFLKSRGEDWLLKRAV